MGLSLQQTDSLFATTPLRLDPATPVHFVGVGGIGMSGLAKILLQAGFQVSGSDLSENAVTKALTELDGQIFKGHDASHVPDNAVVIVSTSINPENPEIAKALSQQQAIYHRSDCLREILQGKTLGHQTTIGIAGTHGKTSITGMTGLALTAAGLNPTIVVGGLIPELGTNAVYHPERTLAVAELDESDGSIIQYQPNLSVISNLELDHAEHYPGGLQQIIDTFKTYLTQLKPGSKLLLNSQCPTTLRLAEELPAHLELIQVSTSEVASHFSGTSYWLKNVRHHGLGGYQGYVYKKTKLLGELHLTVPGIHNLHNALFAIALGDHLGADFDAMTEQLRTFKGMGRRFEKIAEFSQARLFDDYAHHPTEIQATLKAAREMLHKSHQQPQSAGRVVVIFQPHRYTRLSALWDEFSTSFENADQIIITDVYSAHEEPIAGISAAQLADAIQKNYPDKTVSYVPMDADFHALRTALSTLLQPGDITLSMGAGNITGLFRNWPKTGAGTDVR